MQYSDTSNYTGIVQDIDFLAGTNSSSYDVKDKARNVNRWAYKAVTWIIRANRRWKFDDSNLTTLPSATTNLVASQTDYTLPTDLLMIERVEVKKADGNWIKLKSIDQSDIGIALTEFEETDGVPKYYDLEGEIINLYPAPTSTDMTLTAGLRVYYTREIDVFTSADTTQEPGFMELFHRVCSVGAAYDYILTRGTAAKARSLREELEQMKKEIRQVYGERGVDKPKVRTAHRGQDYI